MSAEDLISYRRRHRRPEVVPTGPGEIHAVTSAPPTILPPNRPAQAHFDDARPKPEPPLNAPRLTALFGAAVREWVPRPWSSPAGWERRCDHSSFTIHHSSLFPPTLASWAGGLLTGAMVPRLRGHVSFRMMTIRVRQPKTCSRKRDAWHPSDNATRPEDSTGTRDRMQRLNRKLILAFSTLVVFAGTGYAVQGWMGVLQWTLGLCGAAFFACITLMLTDLGMTYSRHDARIRGIKVRMRLLSTDRLLEIVQDPSRVDFGFAPPELSRRGVDARPQQEQLLLMLTSASSKTRGQAIIYILIFYPETHALIPAGWSNMDSPEMWQSRVAAIRGAS
jgi:hypothetical protein